MQHKGVGGETRARVHGQLRIWPKAGVTIKCVKGQLGNLLEQTEKGWRNKARGLRLLMATGLWASRYNCDQDNFQRCCHLGKIYTLSSHTFMNIHYPWTLNSHPLLGNIVWTVSSRGAVLLEMYLLVLCIQRNLLIWCWLPEISPVNSPEVRWSD